MRFIPFSPPDITQAEIDAVVDVLKSGWITTGPKTKLFEKKIAAYSHAAQAVCLSSQTACAEMTLRILGIGPGDEVIVPAYTYTASASIIYHVGATPVIIDCAPGSYEMDYNKMEDAITTKTKVIIPVDLAGIIADYDKIFQAVYNKKHLFKPSNQLQESFGRIVVMSDGAHAFGAHHKNKVCGEIADFTNFSFHAVKNLTSGEGGAAVWKDHSGLDSQKLYQQFMLFSLHGQTKDTYSKNLGTSWEYDVVDTQYKCNMPDILAAIGLAQLDRYDKMLDRRHELIQIYNKAFANLPVGLLNHSDEYHRSSGHLYFVRLLEKKSDYRNEFIKRMAQNGVICNVHFKPLPMLTAYRNRGFCIDNFPFAYSMHENQITLPLYTTLSNDDADYITSVFKRCMTQNY